MVKKIMELVKKELLKDSVNYGKKMTDNDLLSEEEKGMVLVYLTSSMSLSDNTKEVLAYELTKSWFRLEINEEMKLSKENMKLEKYFLLKIMLKKLEDDKNDKMFIKNLYKEFKNLD